RPSWSRRNGWRCWVRPAVRASSPWCCWGSSATTPAWTRRRWPRCRATTTSGCPTGSRRRPARSTRTSPRACATSAIPCSCPATRPRAGAARAMSGATCRPWSGGCRTTAWAPVPIRATRSAAARPGRSAPRRAAGASEAAAVKLWSIEGNSQKLDGGSMFGNAPRALWTRWATPDDANRIQLATRGLQAAPCNGKVVPFETGSGAFFDPRMRERYGVAEPHHALLDSLRAAGFEHGDVDVVVLSHLHFDHAGGLLAPWAAGRAPELLFPNATFVVGRRHWERACHPH